MSKETISVNEAAKRVGLGVESLQHALIKREFPVDFAVKCTGGKFRYIIPRAAFENMMNGQLFEGLEAALTITSKGGGVFGDRKNLSL